MACNTYFKLFRVIVVLFAYQVFCAASDGCSDQSSRWRDLGGDSCYIIEESDTLSWIDAVYQCFSEGGSLASFHSADDLQKVVDIVQNRTKRFFIGLWKRNDGTFEWVDKSAVDFTNWFPGEPNLYFEKCTELYAESSQWNDIVCEERFGYVCSSPKTSGLNAFSVNNACPGTSEDWEDLGGEFCYIIEEELKTTWDDAVVQCSQAGGSLASFHSFEELSSVVQVIRPLRSGFHIGLRLNIQGKYKWTDGSPLDLDYFSLRNAERNPADKCVSMSSESGHWHGMSCGEVLGYICSAPKVPTCEKNIVADWGEVHSPNYPNYYAPYEKCIWRITVLTNSRVYVEFLDFQVENSKDCEKDFVEIFDGFEKTSPSLGKFCGYGTPDSIRSTTNKITVIFSSDYNVQDFGFYARFERDTCGGVTRIEQGMIYSPHYPQPYRGNENCTWEIIAPENHWIFLRFETFELEAGYTCRYDSVLIRDGLQPEDPVLGKFCGGTVPGLIRSSNNKMAITFVSDGSDQRKGFKAIFRTKDISNYVSVESVFNEMVPLMFEGKIQGAKENAIRKKLEKSKVALQQP